MTDQSHLIFADIWRWSNQTSIPPNDGQTRTVSGAWTDAGELWIACETDASLDVGAELARIRQSDTVRLEQKTDVTRYAVFQATADAIDCGTYFQVNVAYQDGGGSLPNSGTNIVVSILSETTEAHFTAASDSVQPYLYPGTVTCIHGTTTNVARLGTQPFMPGTFALEDFGADVFANHVALTGCDCQLVIDVPNQARAQLADVESDQAPAWTELLEAPAAQAGGTVIFELHTWYPPHHTALCKCQHGWSSSAAFTPGTMPELVALRASGYRNHQLRFACGEPFAPPESSASVPLGGVAGVPRGTSVLLTQQTPTLTGSSLGFLDGKLTILVAGLYSVQAGFSLVRSVAQGAIGQATISVSGTEVASQPLVDQAGVATGSVSWSGTFAAGAQVDVGYRNASLQQQQVVGGALSASSAAVV